MPNKMQKNAAFCSAFGQTRLVIIRTYVYNIYNINNIRYEKAKGRRRMEYMPASETAKKRGISGRRVQKLCEENASWVLQSPAICGAFPKRQKSLLAKNTKKPLLREETGYE